MTWASMRNSATVPTGMRDRVIGVMGGMGAAAANQFVRLLLEAHPRGDDTPGLRFVLDQATEIPDRTASVLQQQATPLLAMLRSLERLVACGASVVAVACNTAHHHHESLCTEITRQRLPVDLLHIVDATLAQLGASHPWARRIGLIATTGTLAARIYEHRSERLGLPLQWVHPTPQRQATAVMTGIYSHIKAGQFAPGRRLLRQAAQELHRLGAQVILLACTEASLVFDAPEMQLGEQGAMPIVDSLRALATLAAQRAREPSPCAPSDNRPAAPATWRTSQRRRFGVMGARSAAAALRLSEDVVRLHTRAKVDQQHVPLLLDHSVINGSSDEAVRSLRRLATAGVAEVACLDPGMQAELARLLDHEAPHVRLIPMLDAALAELDARAPRSVRIGVLGARTAGDWEDIVACLAAAGRHAILPSAAQQALLDACIDPEGALRPEAHTGTRVIGVAKELAEAGAESLLLFGPMPSADLAKAGLLCARQRPLAVVDTLQALAREVIRRAES